MPGPGLNDMKPYGFVAAASTTSQTSMPMRSQSTASSLTSAMLTERKMFSSSFVSSAASGVVTSTTSLQTVRVDGASQALRREAADHLGRRAQGVVGTTGIDALRREGGVEVTAAGEPRLLEQRHEALAQRPG